MKLDYTGTVCALLVLKKSFSPYYWINIMDDTFPFVAIVEQSNFVDKENYNGMCPVYLSRYVDKDSELYNMPEEKLWPLFFDSLRKINPAFSEDWVYSKVLFKAPYTQPIVPIHYSAQLPKFQTGERGLWWVSMSHIYPWDRGTSHSFRVGRELARELLSRL
jgi:protoporphyrinogen oxidase